MHTKNTIKSLLTERGFKQIVPTEDLLDKMGLTLKRFNKIIAGNTELTLTEATAFSLWLCVTLEDLTEVTEADIPNIS